MPKLKKKLLIALIFVPLLAWGAEEGFRLDRAPDRTQDEAALQHGAKLFINYCLNCHGAASMRYNRLVDIGLTEDQIKQSLLFSTDKVGDMMKVAMTTKDAKDWFGAVPPDLSVITRAKSGERGSGADYLYTYLRTYYKDDTRPTGWNNLAYPNSAMPHVLWQLQGVRSAKFVDRKDEHDPSRTTHEFEKFEEVSPGTMKPAEYDTAVADLTAFLSWVAEPAQNLRKRLGVWVLLFLGIVFVLTWRLNAAYWKDIK